VYKTLNEAQDALYIAQSDRLMQAYGVTFQIYTINNLPNLDQPGNIYATIDIGLIKNDEPNKLVLHAPGETIQTSKTIQQVYADDESHFRELVKKLETMSNNN
jgi:hypothetical protein